MEEAFLPAWRFIILRQERSDTDASDDRTRSESERGLVDSVNDRVDKDHEPQRDREDGWNVIHSTTKARTPQGIPEGLMRLE